jgi:hypothetical protein
LPGLSQPPKLTVTASDNFTPISVLQTEIQRDQQATILAHILHTL